MCFSPYLGVGGGGTKGSRAHNLLMQFLGLGSSKMEITSQKVVRSKPGRRIYGEKRHIPPILGLFAYPTPRG